tara:strand:+ start:55 stop:438 length:384 start_codon:yes stop_codon:yes gene_type:complete
MNGLTPKLPLSIDYNAPGGRKLITDYKSLIKQNFKNLLFTVPGERIMDPDFGVGLRTFIFENQSQSTYGSIRAKIGEQVNIYMPFVTVYDIDIASSTEDLNGIVIKISYRIPAFDSADKVEITLPFN